MPSKVGSTKWRIFWSEIVSGGERSLYCWQRVVMHERYGKSKYDFVPFFICTSSQFLRHPAVTIISGSVCGQPWHWPVIGWRVWIYNISHRKWFWWISSMFSIFNRDSQCCQSEDILINPGSSTNYQTTLLELAWVCATKVCFHISKTSTNQITRSHQTTRITMLYRYHGLCICIVCLCVCHCIFVYVSSYGQISSFLHLHNQLVSCGLADVKTTMYQFSAGKKVRVKRCEVWGGRKHFFDEMWLQWNHFHRLKHL